MALASVGLVNVEEEDKAMKAFLFLFLNLSLYGITVTDAINKAIQNNIELKILKQNIDNKQYDIKNQDLYKNPVFSIGLNNISLKKPTARDIEAMQTNYITITQEITNSSKIKYKKQIEEYDKKILQTLLIEKQNKLKLDIYKLFFEYTFLDKKYNILSKKLSNIEKINQYHNSNIEDKKAFSRILKNKLQIDSIELQKEQISARKEQIIISLEKIINHSVSRLDIKEYNEHNNNEFSKQHPLLYIEKLKLKKMRSKSDLFDAKQSANITLYGGYYNREKFDDYINFGVKFPLNIYGREKNDYEKSLNNIKIQKSNYKDLELILYKKYKTAISKKRVTKKSLEISKKLIANIKKEKELLHKQNTKDIVLKNLMFENEILAILLMQENYKKELHMQDVMLDYLTSKRIEK